MAIASVRILRAMGELHLLGTLEQSKQLICLWAGYGHPNSSSFAAGLRLLRTQGMIRPGTCKGHLMLTERGERALPTDMVPPTSTEDVHSRLLTILRPKVTKSAKLEQLWDILKDGEPKCSSPTLPFPLADLEHTAFDGRLEILPTQVKREDIDPDPSKWCIVKVSASITGPVGWLVGHAR